MATNLINVKRSAAPGGWTQPTEILVRRPGAKWATVRSGWLRRGNNWVKIYEPTQNAPASLSPGGTPTNSSAVVAWAAVPGANVTYQLVMRPGVGAAVSYYPPAEPWTANLSMPVSGLAKDTTYTFTVKSRRLLSDGSYLESPESTAKLQLWSGHIAGNTKVGSSVVSITPQHADTWDSNRHWGDYAGDVAQGYASSASKNAYGCVRYGTNVYNQLAAALGADVADNLTVTDAKIERIYRKTGGAGTPTIHVYACLIDFNSTARPTNVYSGTTFTAPAEGDSNDNFEFVHTGTSDRLMNWVAHWATLKPGVTPTHTGLLIFNTAGTGNATAGYNGYCIFRGLVFASDWRLTVSASWSFNPVPADPARWL
jgi:hypothetical protein